MAYLIKAYDYDGEFYGYFAAHPDDPENKSFSYYVNEKKEAKRFESYAEADNMVERFADGSDLEYIIIQDVNKDTPLSDFIEGWVEENYGLNEVNNPSWDINALADAITDFMNNKKDS